MPSNSFSQSVDAQRNGLLQSVHLHYQLFENLHLLAGAFYNECSPVITVDE